MYIIDKPTDVSVTLLRLTSTADFHRLTRVADLLVYLYSVLGMGQERSIG